MRLRCIGVGVMLAALSLAACESSESDGSTPTSRGPATHQDGDATVDATFDVRDLRRVLRAARMAPTPPKPDSVDYFPGATAQRLCADGATVRVFEYPTVDDRVRGSDTIDPIGSPVGNAYIEWIGVPRFYAQGRLIVLVLDDAPRLNATLAEMLGPTLTPDAVARANPSARPPSHPCEREA